MIDQQPNSPADRVPRSWKELVYFSGEPAVSSVGAEVLAWAIATVRDFYSDEWFSAAIDRMDSPVMNPWDASLTNSSAIIRFVERACRVALLSENNHQVLAPPVSMTAEEFFHMELILEVHGLARRAGWSVIAEQELTSARKPDLTVEQLGKRFLVEMTVQGKSRAVRRSEEFSDVLSSLTFATEHEFGVVTHTRATRVASEGEIREWSAQLRSVSRLVSVDRQPREIQVHGLHTTIVPETEGQGRTYEGSLVAEDAWSRFAVRLVDKAEQTSGGPRTWIRIDEVGGLILMTQAAWLPPHEQLHALQHNLEITLEPHPHVAGVLISLGAGPDWNSRTPEFSYFEEPNNPWEAPVVIERRLPGARRRRTFAIPLTEGRRLHLLPGSGLPLGHWYSSESTWLGWALNELNLSPLEDILSSDSSTTHG